jgi:hypothetical protein
MRDVKVTLGVGIVLIAAVGALTLTRAPPRVVRVGTKTLALGPIVNSDEKVCQTNEVLPAGVSAIRVALGSYFGPRVRVTASSDSRVLAEGRRGADWTGTSVTVPVTPLKYTTSQVELCVEVAPNSELVSLSGSPAPERESAILGTGQLLRGRLGVEYLASGQGSWWSRILTVARHMGIGHALSGTWVVLLIAALAAAVGILALRLTWRELP